jgi:hypothetical protein
MVEKEHPDHSRSFKQDFLAALEASSWNPCVQSSLAVVIKVAISLIPIHTPSNPRLPG